jgi:hypothetical protein
VVDMTHFSYAHLRPDLASISASFAEMAHAVLNTLPPNDQRDTCLRKLLEAKDCAVRAYLQGSGTSTGKPGVYPEVEAANQARASAVADATAAEAQIAEDAKRVPTPEEDGVGAPMSQAGAESEAVVRGAQEKIARGVTPEHRMKGSRK